jgi:hypothetical protein
VERWVRLIVGVLKSKPFPSSPPPKQPPPPPPPPPKQEPPPKSGESKWSGEKPRGKKQQQREPPPDTQQQMPHSAEAEQGVLSSIMLDCQQGNRDVITTVAGKINENYFFDPSHRTIYKMLVSLWRANKPIDLIGFTEFLQHKDVLASIGGAAKLTQIFNYINELTGYVPTAANVNYYVEIVVEKFGRREIIADATSLVRGAYGDDVEEFPARVQRLTSRISHIGNAVSNGRFPQLQDTAEFFTTEDPPLPPLVIHQVLHQGSKMLLGGNSKGRKTWALLDLAISVACGAPWWAFLTRKGSVAYVNLEIQSGFFRMRYKKICEAKGIRPEPGMFWHWPLRGHAKPMDKLIADVLGFLQQHRFSLVIIDPIYKTLPGIRGSENDSAMITQLLNEVELLTIETGAAVLFCSHFSKGDQSEKEAMDRVSGSGAWSRDPDSLLMMTPHEEQDCFTVEGVLRNLAPIKPFVVHWDYPLFVADKDLDPNLLKTRKPKPAGRPLQFTEDDILRFMTYEGEKTTAIKRHVCGETGMSNGMFYKLWQELKEHGKIRVDAEERWYPI